jgi:hypothetical protein
MQYIVTGNVYRQERPDPVKAINTGFRLIEQWDVIVRRIEMNPKLLALMEENSLHPVEDMQLWTAKVVVRDDLEDGKYYCYSDEFYPIKGMPDIYLQFAD